MSVVTQRTEGYPVLIIGAGRGGSALLEMFLEDSLVRVVGIADSNPDAHGIQLAKDRGIPTYGDAVKALQACKDYPDCIVYNLSHDDAIAEEAYKVFGDRRVASGPEVKLFWQMVTNLKQIKVDLEKSQDQLQSVISNVMDGIITINESGLIQGFNPAAEDIFGYSQQEALGKNVNMLMPEPHHSLHDTYIDRYLHTGQASILGIRGRETSAIKKNGEEFPMEISISEMVLGGHRYFIGIVRDITERKKAEQKIAHLAHYDYLTDLPNRALMLDVLDHSVALAKRNKHKVAVLFIDLDGFKNINDTLGHDAGDLLLKGVSGRLRQTIRGSDTVARVGGDEFIVVLDNVGSDRNAALVADKIIMSLTEAFDLKGTSSFIGASIGISLYPDDEKDSIKLIKLADEAMYLAKQSGKNTYRFSREVAAVRQGD
ncbi:diguanylate cyclase with PAS/PAC sensor [Sideroxydans lithotrophicus ES-1]|uniref:Sensor protein FixL n=1 Tax=Sideroxydans lithotrophicus (strain ES-1) TaxID=580332 RepID=D5CQN1_SIDLE|nr:diguanylate cyclase with PAS/PAC sensor [Sideroxydans lithotrophicus ES-1]